MDKKTGPSQLQALEALCPELETVFVGSLPLTERKPGQKSSFFSAAFTGGGRALHQICITHGAKISAKGANP